MMNEKEFYMKGSIRLFLGFLLTFGAVGGMEDPANSLLLCLGLASVGLGLMYSGVRAMNGVE
jgi:hypothetical protein